MNLCVILTLSLLFGVVLCASFRWEAMVDFPKRRHMVEGACQMSSDGSLHMFWQADFSDLKGFVYQIIPVNGAAKDKTINLDTAISAIHDIDAQISSNGEHLLVALVATKANSSRKVLFVESLNRGESWSAPMLICGNWNDDTIQDLHQILLEKDTGRVHILYKKTTKVHTKPPGLAICTREPGWENFESEIELPTKQELFNSHIGYTIDKANGQRKLHVLAKTQNEQLVYSQSVNNGRTWSDFFVVASGYQGGKSFEMATDTSAVEGGIYAQHYDNNIAKIVWSIDHGKNFQEVTRFSTDKQVHNLLAVCGSEGKSIVVSSHDEYYVDKSYLKVSISHSRSFADVRYPFSGARDGIMKQFALTCRHVGNGEFHITYVVAAVPHNLIWIARGILKDV